jgi:hypothetical protein
MAGFGASRFLPHVVLLPIGGVGKPAREEQGLGKGGLKLEPLGGLPLGFPTAVGLNDPSCRCRHL